MRLWLGLLGAEFTKLRHLVVFRAVVVSLLLGPGVMILVLRLVASDITTVVESPGEVVLGSVILLAAFGGVVLSAAVLGREFDLGTARVSLLRGAPRFRLLLAKIATAILSACGASLAATLLGIGEAMLVGWEPTAAQAAEILARTLALVPLVSLSYVGVTMLGSILGRSAAAGMLAGLALFLGDFLLSSMRTRIPLGEWLPVTNLFTLVGGTFASILPPENVASAGVAVGRLMAFGAAAILAAAVVFERQDIHQ